jgi:hypothetical protein
LIFAAAVVAALVYVYYWAKGKMGGGPGAALDKALHSAATKIVPAVTIDESKPPTPLAKSAAEELKELRAKYPNGVPPALQLREQHLEAASWGLLG